MCAAEGAVGAFSPNKRALVLQRARGGIFFPARVCDSEGGDGGADVAPG